MVAAARIERASEGYEPSLGPIQIRRIDNLFGYSEHQPQKKTTTS
jgi:hypothetical protein